MVILIVTIILILLTFAGVVIFAFANRSYRRNDERDGNAKLIKSHFFISFAALVWLVIPLFASIVKINANEVGVIYDELNGGVQERTYDEGLHTKSIFETVTPISTINRETKLETTGQTSDGQYVTFEISLIYKIEALNAGNFFKATGASDITAEAMNTIVKQMLQKVNQI